MGSGVCGSGFGVQDPYSLQTIVQTMNGKRFVDYSGVLRHWSPGCTRVRSLAMLHGLYSTEVNAELHRIQCS